MKDSKPAPNGSASKDQTMLLAHADRIAQRAREVI
jgi:hypothetical protein